MTTIKSTCGKYAVNFIKNGGRNDAVIAMANLATGSTAYGDTTYEYWFYIGKYKSEKTAIRQSVKRMRQHGIELAIPNN